MKDHAPPLGLSRLTGARMGKEPCSVILSQGNHDLHPSGVDQEWMRSGVDQDGPPIREVLHVGVKRDCDLVQVKSSQVKFRLFVVYVVS